MMDDQGLHHLGSLPGISLAHINIRSLFGKLEDVIRILEFGKISVLAISETWLNSYVPDNMINIAKYELVRGDRTAESGKRAGGGVCFYIQDKYNFVTHEELTLIWK